jgi:hypothetical protein
MVLSIHPPYSLPEHELSAAVLAVIKGNPTWQGTEVDGAHPIRGPQLGEPPLREQINSSHLIIITDLSSNAIRGTLTVIFDGKGAGVAYVGKMTSSAFGLGAQLLSMAARLADQAGQSKLHWHTYDERVANMYAQRYGLIFLGKKDLVDGSVYVFEADINDPIIRQRSKLLIRPD